MLFVVFMIQSMGWSFFPVLMPTPFELRGIKSHEMAIVTSSIHTIVWIGAFVGPISSRCDPRVDREPVRRA